RMPDSPALGADHGNRKQPAKRRAGSRHARLRADPASNGRNVMGAEAYRCGAIALIGRPNVGKSTLLNALLGQKLSNTSRKPQTTRQSLRGVLTTETAQFVLVDTPGFQTRHRGALNRAMNRAIRGVLEAIDIVVLVVEAK